MAAPICRCSSRRRAVLQTGSTSTRMGTIFPTQAFSHEQTKAVERRYREADPRQQSQARTRTWRRWCSSRAQHTTGSHRRLYEYSFVIVGSKASCMTNYDPCLGVLASTSVLAFVTFAAEVCMSHPQMRRPGSTDREGTSAVPRPGQTTDTARACAHE